MKTAIYGKTLLPDSLSYIQELIDTLVAGNIHPVIYEPFFRTLSHSLTLPVTPSFFNDTTPLPDDIDFLVSIGGDGTLLDTLIHVGGSGIPVLGINLGRMGFLSNISKTEIGPAIRHILEGNYSIDARSLISLEAPQEIFGHMNYALNELTINKKDTSSMIQVHVWVDDTFLHSYWADGLIVSTPTGSTAYSLSCNGPIIAPDSAAFVITPIATHNLTVRPVVIPDTSSISIRVEGRASQFLVSLDSRSAVVTPETRLLIRKAAFKVNLLQLKGQNFFRTLREKLSWGTDIRN